ncbi:MAG: hypothetical protein HOW73_43900 [Polyangiaceae bacterium]|nr:hypothetical protein [Polyangiaceae bacterium]
MLWQTVARDDVAVPVSDTAQSNELGEAAAWVICMEAGERAREGSLQTTERSSYELQLRCALATQPSLIKTYLGYLDLAILAGEILLRYARRTDGCDEPPPCGEMHARPR